ncbi:3-dehydroquinate synthase [candidate division KSB1 bacterium]|nr:3-dehydroquinate synthase [candidate division KSB1 bacterium]
MKGITVDLGPHSYPIYVESDSLKLIGKLAKEHHLGQKVAIITDVNVAKHYREDVESCLQDEEFQVLGFILPAGEQTKNLKMADYLYEKLIEANFDRNSVIISLGGGVIGDLAGFVAATFMRGITFVQIPTTLLAQTDSSVGGKVGINHRLGKNLVGAFHQPKFVLIDPEVLKTLPQREIWSGLAEIVKYALISDAEFFDFLEDSLGDLALLKNMADVEMVIEHCCSIKASVVNQDEKESGLRRILNFGHTFGHAFEALTDYAVLRHGEAVALGMRGIIWLCKENQLLDEEEYNRIDNLLQRLRLPETVPDFNPKDALKKIYHDKKVIDGVLNLVLLKGIGKPVIRKDITEDVLLSTLEFLRKQILVKNFSARRLKP